MTRAARRNHFHAHTTCAAHVHAPLVALRISGALLQPVPVGLDPGTYASEGHLSNHRPMHATPAVSPRQSGRQQRVCAQARDLNHQYEKRNCATHWSHTSAGQSVRLITVGPRFEPALDRSPRCATERSVVVSGPTTSAHMCPVLAAQQIVWLAGMLGSHLSEKGSWPGGGTCELGT